MGSTPTGVSDKSTIELAKATVRELLDEPLTLTRDDTSAVLSIEKVEPGLLIVD